MLSDDFKRETPRIIAPPLLGSCRLSITFVLLLGSFTTIFMSGSLKFAVICVDQRDKNSNNLTQCDVNKQKESHSCVQQPGEVFWDKSMQGLLLGASFYGVASTQILIGYLSDKYGHCKLQMLVGALVLSLANILSPFVIIYLGNYYFFALRVLMGMAMTCMLLPKINLMKNWVSAKDQGLLVGISMGGMSVANAVSNPIGAAICNYGGWRSIFYLPGACGLSWSILGFFLVYDSPNKHPRISVEEKQYFETHGLTSKTNRKSKAVIPWLKILTSVPVWSVVISQFFYFAVFEGITVTLPMFIKEALGFNITENGIYSALPAIGNTVMRFSAGPIFDYVRSKNLFSLTSLRKIFHITGTVIPAIMMFGVSQTGPDKKYLILPFIIIGASSCEMTHVAGIGLVLMDVAPSYFGILHGINNTISVTPGIVMPLVIAALTPDGTLGEWNHVYLMFSCLIFISCLVFTLTGDARRQKWDEIKDDTAI